MRGGGQAELMQCHCVGTGGSSLLAVYILIHIINAYAGAACQQSFSQSMLYMQQLLPAKTPVLAALQLCSVTQHTCSCSSLCRGTLGVCIPVRNQG